MNKKYIEDYLRYIKTVKKYSDYTIISYQEDIEEFNNYLNNSSILKINYETVSLYLEYLYKLKLNRNSISRKLSSLRGFYEYLKKENLIETNYFKEVSNPKKYLTLPKYVDNNDLEKMFMVPNLDTPLGQRNRLIIELLYATGIRVGELVSIKLEDIELSQNTIKILGKGSKERIVIYGSFCEDILDLYLSDGRKELKPKSNYLILNKNGNKLTTRAVRDIIDNIILQAHINSHVSPHMLRHTFATDLLSNGADLMSVKELLGHSSLNTTSIYTHLTDEQIRNVYNNTHPRAKV